MKAIFKRELMAYFITPIGCTFIGVFAIISGIYFNLYVLQQGNGDIAAPLTSCMIVLVLLVPVLTMRLIAEERGSRTDQLLMSSPVGVWSIVLGKLGAAMCVYVGAMVTTFPYIIIIAIHGAPQWGGIVATYVGFVLLGLSFVSIGLFFSSVTESQIIALVITLGTLLGSFLLNYVPSTSFTLLNKLLSLISVTERFYDFRYGVFKLESVVYYLCLSAVFIFFTVRNIEKRRWS